MLPMQNKLTGVSEWIVLLAASSLIYLLVLSLSVVNVALPYIAGDLGVSVNTASNVITFFAAGNAITLPIAGSLSERFGCMRVLMTCTMLFLVATLFCALAPDFQMLSLGRFLQGFVSGPLLPLAQSLIVLVMNPDNKMRNVSVVSSLVMLAPGTGLLLGGWLAYDYTWRLSFYGILPLCFVVLVVFKRYLPSFETPIIIKPFNYFGFSLLFIGTVSLQYLLERGQQDDWFHSPMIVILMAISVVAFMLLLIWEWRHEAPVLAIMHFRKKSFALSSIILALSLCMLYGTLLLMPMFMSVDLHYTPVSIGLVMLVVSVVPLLLSPLNNKLIQRYGTGIPLALSFVFFASACFYFSFMNTQMDMWHIFIGFVLLGIGSSFYFGPLIAMSMKEIEPDYLAQAAGLFYFIRAMAGGIGASVFVTLWQRREIFHHEVLGYQVSMSNHNTTQMLHRLKEHGISGPSANAYLNDLLDQQASVLAMNECFMLMGFMILACLIFLPFAGSQKAVSQHILHQGEHHL